ncbi:MAG: NAD-dependent epimerase/dehydratase family protein, partial [Actinomycetota bacterium]
MSISDEPKRVLVTGATGLIGSHCLAPLLQRGYEVHAVSAKHRLTHGSSIVWHRSDIFEQASRAHLMELVRPTHLLHLAWYVVPGKAIESDINFEWVASSMALLQLFHQQGGRRVVMVGSAEEYDLSYGYCHETRTPTNPQTV